MSERCQHVLAAEVTFVHCGLSCEPSAQVIGEVVAADVHHLAGLALQRIPAHLDPPLQRQSKLSTTSSTGPNNSSANRLDRILELSKRQSGIQLPLAFIRLQRPPRLLGRRPAAPKGTTPLARMLRGGQGGEVRLKLYLTITLLAAHPPFDISRQIASRTWAEMLALPDPEHRGARRVIDAVAWLQENDFLLVERHGGSPPTITLRNASGRGGNYVKPTSPYVTLPIGYWEQQWITALSGTATGLLLVLLELSGGKNRAPAQWVNRERRGEYCLSDDSWTRATKELCEFGLLEVGRVSSGHDLEYTRRRNTYQLNKDRLAGPVPIDVLERRIEERRRASKRKTLCPIASAMPGE